MTHSQRFWSNNQGCNLISRSWSENSTWSMAISLQLCDPNFYIWKYSWSSSWGKGDAEQRHGGLSFTTGFYYALGLDVNKEIRMIKTVKKEA